jgi:YebC/PmpR family DNA-binding regulatory protein
MSGHSHWATTHRQKELDAAKRGNLFSKLARAIIIAVKDGGGSDPDSNFKLRDAIDKARAASMPKENIERAINHAAGGEAIEEVTYEGFGPSGIGVIVQVATDNKNRTAQEIKNLFERGGGSLAGPGSVAFNFESKGFLLLEKMADPQVQMLSLIDLGVDDINEVTDGIEVYVSPDKLGETRKKLEANGFKVKSAELTMEAKSYVTISDPQEIEKAANFLEMMEEHDDVQKVYSNLDIQNNRNIKNQISK